MQKGKTGHGIFICYFCLHTHSHTTQCSCDSRDYMQEQERTDSDIEPPDFDAPPSMLDEAIYAVADASVAWQQVAPAVAPRSKPPTRAAPAAFDSPICIALHNGMWGHYDVSNSMFWAGAVSAPAAVARADLDACYDAEQCTLPSGAQWPVPAQDIATAEYINFSEQAQLVVQPVQSLAVLRAVCAENPDAIAAVVFYDDAPDDAAGHMPLLVGAHAVITLRSSADAVWVAQRLLFSDTCATVVPGTAVGQTGSAARPVVRTQCVSLHWIKDTDVVPVLTRFADTLAPALASTPLPLDLIPSFQRIMYEADKLEPGLAVPVEFKMRRDNLNWGAFATQFVAASGLSLSRRRDATRAVLARTAEPLASYARALLQIQEARSNGSAGRAAITVLDMPTFNTPPKMTPTQVAHILRLYYWAVIHVDEGTARIPRAVARAGIELYLRFGCAVVRRRAYVFHTSTGKRRRTHTAVAAVAADDVEASS